MLRVYRRANTWQCARLVGGGGGHALTETLRGGGIRRASLVANIGQDRLEDREVYGLGALIGEGG